MRAARLDLRDGAFAACDAHWFFRTSVRAEAGGWGKAGGLAEGAVLRILWPGEPVTDRMPGAMIGTVTTARPVAPPGWDEPWGESY
jgi:hypothetical protein